MKPNTNGGHRTQRSNNFQREGQGPNWVLIAGGALLSTLSVRLGFKLKQLLDSKQQDDANSSSLKGKGKQRKQTGLHSHSTMYSYMQEDDGCFNCVSGNLETNHLPSNGDADVALPLVTVPPPEFNLDRLELPPKPFHYSNCSADSPSVSESGSDIFTKREVIHKLRQQLKRRDEMILEMQDQIAEYQNSFNAQLEHSALLQAQLDAANRDLFDSQREIQRLRKAIADHCVGSKESPPRQSHSNGYMNGDQNGYDSSERIEMLKKEVGELKEVIEGKEYLVQSYKEQKAELSLKIKELQNRNRPGGECGERCSPPTWLAAQVPDEAGDRWGCSGGDSWLPDTVLEEEVGGFGSGRGKGHGRDGGSREHPSPQVER